MDSTQRINTSGAEQLSEQIGMTSTTSGNKKQLINMKAKEG